MDAGNLLSKYPIITDQIEYKELAAIIRELATCLRKDVAGDVVEMGCYAGTTSLFIKRTLDCFESSKEFHVYDSFEGLPPKSQQDNSPSGEQFKAGELAATKRELIRNFQRAHLKPPIIHKSWFSDLRPEDIPTNICFAFLDGDFYESIRDCLALIWPRLSAGATIIVDDYASDSLPGAKKAVDEWLLKNQPVDMHSEASLAIIRT